MSKDKQDKPDKQITYNEQHQQSTYCKETLYNPIKSIKQLHKEVESKDNQIRQLKTFAKHQIREKNLLREHVYKLNSKYNQLLVYEQCCKDNYNKLKQLKKTLKQQSNNDDKDDVVINLNLKINLKYE